MGFMDLFRRSQRLADLPAYAPNGAPVNYDAATLRHVLGLSLEDLWRTQPHLRTVVSFLARNIAQLGLHTFERVSDTDRKRDRGGVTAQLLAAPNEGMTTFDLVQATVADRALYDMAYWWVAVDDTRPSGWRIDVVPPSWVIGSGGGTRFAPAWYDIAAGQKGKPAQRVDASELIIFPGWNPGFPSSGSSPVDALKAILSEQIHAYIYRQQVWERGGRVGTYIVRPPAAPEWSKKAKERFQSDWNAQWTGDDGPRAGGTPIFEDGMSLEKTRFSSHEEEWVEASKLALSTVAQVFHVNPTMIGLLDNANFSNVREFRKMLYGDTLGPIIASLESRINTFLLPMIGEDADRYVEFNIREKLQGNFEEQTQALQSAIGRPWMKADEGRAMLNMPALGGDADELVTPLNVLVGGQASARDSGSQNLNAGTTRRKSGDEVRFKDSDLIPPTYGDQVASVLRRYFKRQRAVVLTALGAKAGTDWWDADRWNTELADDLYALAATLSKEMGRRQAEALGFDSDEYDVDRTLKFLRAVAESRAGAVNATTLERLQKAIENGDEPASVFDEAQAVRTGTGSTAFLAALAGFALTEAAKQTVGPRSAEKVWVVNSANPRAEHAAMNGQRVPVDEPFSNGADWPGDPMLGADGVAGCQCSVDIIIG